MAVLFTTLVNTKIVFTLTKLQSNQTLPTLLKNFQNGKIVLLLKIQNPAEITLTGSPVPLFINLSAHVLPQIVIRSTVVMAHVCMNMKSVMEILTAMTMEMNLTAVSTELEVKINNLTEISVQCLKNSVRNYVINI